MSANPKTIKIFLPDANPDGVNLYFIINNEVKRVSDLDGAFKEKMTNRPKINEY